MRGVVQVIVTTGPKNVDKTKNAKSLSGGLSDIAESIHRLPWRYRKLALW